MMFEAVCSFQFLVNFHQTIRHHSLSLSFLVCHHNKTTISATCKGGSSSDASGLNSGDPSSNANRHTDCSDCRFSWLSLTAPGKCWDSTVIRPQLLPSTSFSVGHSSIFVPFTQHKLCIDHFLQILSSLQLQLTTSITITTVISTEVTFCM